MKQGATVAPPGLRWLWLLPLFAVPLATAGFIWNPSPVRSLRHTAFDHFQRWQPRSLAAAADLPVRIVDIDEESLQKLGQWPWPRLRIAELITRLRDTGAAAIVFDLLFTEADRTSPRAMAALWPLSPVQRQSLAALPDHDAVLAEAIAGGRVVLGFAAADAAGRDRKPLPMQARFVTLGDPAVVHVRAVEGIVPPLPIFSAVAAGAGATAFFADGDGVVRKVPLLLRNGPTLLPSLAAEALRVAQAGPNANSAANYVTRADASRGLLEVKIGGLTVPTTENGEIWVRYAPSSPARYVPAWKLLTAAAPDTRDLTGRIVLIGSSAQGLMDLRFSPLGDIIPGVEVHAQLIEQLLSGDGTWRPDWSGGAETLAIAGGGLLVVAAVAWLGAPAAFALLAGLLATFWVAAWLAFVRHGLLIDAANPSVALLLVYLVAGIVRLMASERRQRWVRAAFSRYVSPNLVDHLIAHPETLELSGRRQHCSFIFTDLSGFTALMEKMDPAATVATLNDYLDRMIAVAFAHQGTLDRIVGDAVVVMFSAPVPQADYRQRALACGLAMQRFANQHRRDLAQQGIEFGQTRIGIHAGEVIVGNFGGGSMFDYRALGDPINTASRLEGANKYFGTQICVSEAILAACSADVVQAARPIGRVMLAGKAQPLLVFEPQALDEGVVGSAAFALRADAATYRQAFAALERGSVEALAAFEALAARYPFDGLVVFHRDRLRRGASNDFIHLDGK